MRLLLVENEPRNAKLMRRVLKASTYAVDCCVSAEDALYHLKINNYDLIILEVQLPDRDGIELCESVRADGDETPILILSGRDSVDDRINGLDAGADDYMVKPFEIRELLARIRALLRRPKGGLIGTSITVGEMQVDTRNRTVVAGSTKLDLTNKEYALLEYFARNADRVIGREEIADHVWNETFDPFSNVIEVYINRLRKKISARVDSPVLRTRRGSGYVLELFADLVVK